VRSGSEMVGGVGSSWGLPEVFIGMEEDDEDDACMLAVSGRSVECNVCMYVCMYVCM